MKNQKVIFTAMEVLILLVAVTACAGYGKLSATSNEEQNALLKDLVSHSGDYDVYYYGNSERLVSGILFDPKSDDKHIRPEGKLWKKIDDPETIAGVIDSIDRSLFPGYFQQLYAIDSPSGELYGYLYTGWNYLVIKPVDERTVRVYGLSGPPEYEDAFPGMN
ncbi:MAG: hypothetical protein LJE94_17655 [Deltaproteobacteria bacterium]|nr:hypothetical protein [Deltaproteobacteria bacterium]